MFEKFTNPSEYAKIVTYETVNEMWTHCVGEYGKRAAVLYDGVSHSFEEIDDDIARLRAVLKRRGVQKGCYVGVYATNSYAFVKAYLASVTLGAVAVLLPPHLDETAVYGCTVKFGLKALIFNEGTQSKLSLVAEKNPDVLLSADERAAEREGAAELTGDAPCAVLFTGGTTGKSKGALLSHRAIMRGTRNGCYGIWNVFYQKYYLVLPLTHVFGLIRNLMTSLYTGSEICICKNNKDMFKEMPVFQPTVLVFVPALAEMALGLSKQFGRNMLGDSVKYIICGAATVPPYLKREYKKFGVTLLAGYGLTESANLVSANPLPEDKADSIGIPYPEQQIKIVDGELWLKGPNMLTCYVGDEGANKDAFSEDGWFKTGDLVRLDEDGFLYIIGRTKEIIVLASGENISPAEYENKFNALDIVQDSLIYENTEENMLVLEVLPRQTALALVEAADKTQYLKDKLSEVNMTLPPFARVGKIIIRDTDFKRSPSMKILRKQS